MSAGRDIRQQKSQQKNSNDAVLGHNPVQSRLPARWFSLGIFIPQGTVFRASWLASKLHLTKSKYTKTGQRFFPVTAVVSGLETVTWLVTTVNVLRHKQKRKQFTSNIENKCIFLFIIYSIYRYHMWPLWFVFNFFFSEWISIKQLSGLPLVVKSGYNKDYVTSRIASHLNILQDNWNIIDSGKTDEAQNIMFS